MASLELPVESRESLQPEYLGRVVSVLAGGLKVEEDAYRVTVRFDDNLLAAEDTFVDSASILIDTQLLANCRLEIDFVAKSLRIERID